MANIDQFLKFYEEDKAQQANAQSQNKTATQKNNAANNSSPVIDNNLKTAFELLRAKNLSSITNANTLLTELQKMSIEDVKNLMTTVYKAMGDKGSKKLNTFNAALEAKTQEDARNGKIPSQQPIQTQQATPGTEDATIEAAQVDQVEKATNVNISTVAQFVNELVKARQAKGNTNSNRFKTLQPAAKELAQMASEDKRKQAVGPTK